MQRKLPPDCKKRRTGLIAKIFRHRFVRSEDGVTLIEFGILAIPFFILVGAILETALVFFASQILDSAVDNGTRLIRTGQAQTAGYTISNFRSAICDYLYGMFDCDQLKIEVTKLSSFSTAEIEYPLDEDDGSWEIEEAYNAGQGSDVIMVEVYYKWPTILDFFEIDLSNTPDGARLMSAVRVFKNEPF